MYISNQRRQRRYRKDRNAEEENAEGQQIRFYNYLSKNALDEEQASELADLATNVVQKITAPEKQTGLSKLIKAITDGKFDDFMRKMEKIPVEVLSPSEKIVQHVLKTQEYKRTVNEHLAKLVDHAEATPKRVVSALVEAMQSNDLFKKRMRAQSEESVSSNYDEEKAEPKSVIDELADKVDAALNYTGAQGDTKSQDETISLSEDRRRNLIEEAFSSEEFNKLTLADLRLLRDEINKHGGVKRKTLYSVVKETTNKKLSDITLKKELGPVLKEYLKKVNLYGADAVAIQNRKKLSDIVEQHKATA